MKCFRCRRDYPLNTLRFVEARRHKHHVCPLCLKVKPEPKPSLKPKCEHNLELRFSKTVRELPSGLVLEIHNEYICRNCGERIVETYKPNIGWLLGSADHTRRMWVSQQFPNS